jgi:predicted transcriptional regulator
MDESGLENDTRLLQRGPILAACRDGPADRSTIAERSGSSRTTVYRATTELVAEGLLKQQSAGYSLTNFGVTMLDRLTGFRAKLDGARHLRPLLDRIDAPELREHVDLFADATVIKASPDAPYAVDQQFASIIDANRGAWFGFTRSFGSPSVVEAVSAAIFDGASAEWVFTSDTITALSEQHPEHQTNIRALDRTTSYVVDSLPFDFAVLDETLVLIGSDATTGVHVAIATTDNPDAVAWARDIFETYRNRAERVA